ncbi:MAG: NifU family protein [Alphaproteobacteria bacterium]
MFIQTEETPNPNSLKFIPGFALLDTPMDFPNAATAKISPLAARLFAVDGVEGVFIGKDFITITKQDQAEWYALKPSLLGSMIEHLLAKKPLILDEIPEESVQSETVEGTDREIIDQIQELINSRVRPAVAADGGDIVFTKFEDGVVFLKMKGACSGCPSSSATLKSGIENMLRYYVPEVTEVRAV